MDMISRASTKIDSFLKKIGVAMENPFDVIRFDPDTDSDSDPENNCTVHSLLFSFSYFP
jgi:hypothetical protein